MNEKLRDRIVILGRPSAGKSVLLTILYQQLWDSPGEISVRAADGITHANLMNDFASLMQGQWLPATQALRRIDLELQHRGRCIPLTVLDYPGELYRRMFFEKRVDSDELQALYDHIDRALGVILLIDPRDAVGGGEAQLDTEYAAIQVIEHFRGNENGRTLPLVVVYTKRDENSDLIRRAGGVGAFTRSHMPRMWRLLKDVPLVHLSALRTVPTDAGRRAPWLVSSQEQVIIPIRLILERIEAAESKRRSHLKDDWRRVWSRHWRPVFITTTAVCLFVVFFILGVWVAS